MPKIERRRIVETLHHGTYEAELLALQEQAESALRAEMSGAAPQRAATKSKSAALARKHDELRAEADETAVHVTVWALRWDQMQALEDEHPPREDDDRDKQFALNMLTFPKALLEASLVDPDTLEDPDDLDELKSKGRAALAEMDLRKVHFKRLATAAWNVNVGDDALGKFSLVSLLAEAKEIDSAPQSDSESVPRSSRASSPKKRIRTTTPKETSPDEPS